MNKRVVLGLSGGVDSAVAGLLLKQAGYEVIAVMLRTWRANITEPAPGDLTDEASENAEKIARKLDIPFQVRDIRAFFKKKVVDYFLESYTQGTTPNPCIRCNREVKWHSLFASADEYGADWVATGHYARVNRQVGQVQLHKAVDIHKDQSYFLCHLSMQDLERTLLPNGKYTKEQVRLLATQADLPVATRSESQDLCFLEGQDYRPFLAQYHPDALQPGKIVDTAGRLLGEHSGLANYTIGQRRGLGISSEQPLYVLFKNPSRNLLVLGSKDELGRDHFLVEIGNWIDGEMPARLVGVEVKIRSQARPVPASIVKENSNLYQVELSQTLRDITPGQFAVFYRGEVVLGCGEIQQFN